jgi:hypothetical protein
MLSNYWCGAEIVGGRLKLDEKLAFKASMRRMKPGRVVVKVEQPATKRTLDQNAYWHAVPFPILAEHFGDSVEGVKYDLMGEKWGWRPSPLNPDRMVPVKPSTSSMTIEEGVEFTEWLLAWAATEHGVLIPLPSEYSA